MKPLSITKFGAAVLALNPGLINPPQKTVVISAPGDTAALLRAVSSQIPAPAPKKARKPRQPTKTEIAAREFLLRTGRYSEVRWNSLTFTLENGHRYTPDLVAVLKDDPQALTVFEVKGSYRLGSLQRSRLAFDQARIEWPMFRFVWMERRKDGSWNCS